MHFYLRIDKIKYSLFIIFFENFAVLHAIQSQSSDWNVNVPLSFYCFENIPLSPMHSVLSEQQDFQNDEETMEYIPINRSRPWKKTLLVFSHLLNV